MSDDLEYKGYKGSVEFCADDRMFFGKVLFIDSLLMYHGTSVDGIEHAFRETVDNYLAHCERTGKSPNKPYSGTFNTRIGPERHRAVAELAYRRKASINEVMCHAVDAYLHSEGSPVVINHHHHHHSQTAVRQSATEESPLMRMRVEEETWQPARPH